MIIIFRKTVGLTLSLVLLLCSCQDSRNNNWDTTTDQIDSGADSQQTVIGQPFESYHQEYPHFDSSVNFESVGVISTVSVPSSSQGTSTGSNITSSSVSSASSSSKAPSTSSNSNSSGGDSDGGYTPLHYAETRAVWISYLELNTLLKNKSESVFRNNIKQAYTNSKNLGLNTVVVQIRPNGDALYPSEYYPWSVYAAGIGVNPGFDPLSIMVEEAHKLSLSFHAWINPFRTFFDVEVSKVSTNYPFKQWYNDADKKGYNIVNVSNRWYYNPGVPEVRQLIVNGVAEIVKNYPVDAIHFDDYFYPTTAASFDKQAYEKYGSGKSLAQWRRDCISDMVKAVYSEVHKINSKVQFGISPQGNINNNMNTQYADVKLWCSSSGYLDYICPQVYYNYKSETVDFLEAINAWSSLVTAKDVKLYIGMAAYKVGNEFDTFACLTPNKEEKKACFKGDDGCGAIGWQVSNVNKSDILKRQYNDSLKLNDCSGIMLYRYDSLFRPASTVSAQIAAEIQFLKDAFAK